MHLFVATNRNPFSFFNTTVTSKFLKGLNIINTISAKPQLKINHSKSQSISHIKNKHSTILGNGAEGLKCIRLNISQSLQFNNCLRAIHTAS